MPHTSQNCIHQTLAFSEARSSRYTVSYAILGKNGRSINVKQSETIILLKSIYLAYTV